MKADEALGLVDDPKLRQALAAILEELRGAFNSHTHLVGESTSTGPSSDSPSAELSPARQARL